MDVKFTGLIPLCTQIQSDLISLSEETASNLNYKKFLEHYILSNNLFYLVFCIPPLLDEYLNVYSTIIDDIVENINRGVSIKEQLYGEPAHLTWKAKLIDMAFFVDTHPLSGGGHLHRSMNLASEFRHGCDVVVGTNGFNKYIHQHDLNALIVKCLLRDIMILSL